MTGVAPRTIYTAFDGIRCALYETNLTGNPVKHGENRFFFPLINMPSTTRARRKRTLDAWRGGWKVLSEHLHAFRDVEIEDNGARDGVRMFFKCSCQGNRETIAGAA